MKASDENGNGSVDLSQFMALWISFKAKVGEDGDTEDDIKTAFQEYDIDNDDISPKGRQFKDLTLLFTLLITTKKANKVLCRKHDLFTS